MRKLFAILAVCTFASVASAWDGIPVVLDVTGAESWDAYGAASNDIWVIDAAAALGLPSGTAVTMNGIGWDVGITTVGGSFLSEARMYFDDNIAPDGVGLWLTPGYLDGFAGSGFYYDPGIDLEDNGIPNVPLPDGLLRIEFNESYDDAAGAVDADYTATSTLTLDLVPEPASLALIGLGAIVLIRRR